MALCSPLCGDADVRVYCTPCDRQAALRKGAINYIGLLDCDTTFDDITDATEWETYLSEGKIKLLPELVGELGEPETETARISACRDEEITDETTTLTAQIFLFDNSTFTDFDMEYDLKNKVAAKTLFFVDCNNILYYRYNWIPGYNPGFGNLTTTVSRQFPTDGLQSINVGITFNTFRTGYKGFSMSPELSTIISSACAENS